MTGNHGILDFVAFFYAKRYCGGPFSSTKSGNDGADGANGTAAENRVLRGAMKKKWAKVERCREDESYRNEAASRSIFACHPARPLGFCVS